jgi:AmiR/NasT family two-component response regulator
MIPMRIIIAEKDRIFRKNLKEILTQSGYIVAGEAEDGIKALKMVRGMHPDLVIASIGLHGMNGFELARIIEEERLCPIVVIADYSDKNLFHRVGESWSVPVLIKPFDEIQLLSVLKYAYSVYSKMAELENEVSKLKNDLESRKIIEKAKGILMRLHSMSEDTAFKKIQQQSMKKRTTMKKIAEAIIMTYEISDIK